MKYVVVIEKGPTSYGAYVPDLPGCVAVGGTVHEVERLIEEAIEFHIEGLRQDGEQVPVPTSILKEINITSTKIRAARPYFRKTKRG